MGDRAYEPALEVMERVRFEGPRPTLRGQWERAGPRARSAFGKMLHDLCRGLAGEKDFDGMKRAFVALPDPRAVPAFEGAIAAQVRAGDSRAALGLLLFATGQGLATPALER